MFRLSLSALSALLLIACGAHSTSDSEVTLQTKEASFQQPAVATVLLWGYDKNLADASATLVKVFENEVDQVPVTLTLDVPADAHSLIDQGNGPVAMDQAAFYYTIYVDVDGDGQICPGDYSRDFDQTGFESFDGQPPATIQVPLKKNGSDYTCRPAIP